MQPLHQPDNHDKLAALTDSITANGWTGAPLVTWDDQLLTGSHRYAAAKAAGLQDPELPVEDIEDIFADHDLDFAAEYEMAGEPDIGSVGFIRILELLPQGVRDEYGLDMH